MQSKDLLEKLEVTRDSLEVFQALAEVGDAKKLAEFVSQKMPVDERYDIDSPMWRDYMELRRYMEPDQADRMPLIYGIGYSANRYLKEGKSDPIKAVMGHVPRLIQDLNLLKCKINAE